MRKIEPELISLWMWKGVTTTYKKDGKGEGSDYTGSDPDHPRLHDQREALLPGSDATVEC
jgi:hypothetical protein